VSLHKTLIGLRVHAVVIALVWAALIPVNIFMAPGFPWSVFVVAGTGIGLFFHCSAAGTPSKTSAAASSG